MKRNLVYVLLAFLTLACQSKKAEENKEDATTVVKKTEVKVATLSIDTVDRVENYTATINAYDKIYLAPIMPGRIKDIMVEVNDEVRAGDLVVKMDDAQLLQLKVQFQNLEKEMERMIALKKTESVSEQQYDQVKASYDAMATNFKNIEENTRLDAPFTGVVTGRFYDDGELYSAAPNTPEGKAAILTIEKIGKLKVEVSMSERYFPAVTNGLTATLTTDIYPNEEFEGVVSLVYPTIDAATRTFKVEVTIPNADKKLRPGMYSKVAVKLGEKAALMMPSAAVLILEGTNTRYVYVVESKIVKRVPVTIGERFDDMLEVISDDLKPGDKYIVAGQSKVQSGDEVVIVR